MKIAVCILSYSLTPALIYDDDLQNKTQGDTEVRQWSMKRASAGAHSEYNALHGPEVHKETALKGRSDILISFLWARSEDLWFIFILVLFKCENVLSQTY